uniref:Transducer of regulated CREB activity N-terminal domain-containing protein n=1 Tax=Panagrolaimus sp. JU765 TaxID=591449 RepID=A0AC34QP41_9BILA
MSQTPRKFSEKIAMMARKQNEDQEAFHSVMNEVLKITKKPTTGSPGSSDGSPVNGPPNDQFMMGGPPMSGHGGQISQPPMLSPGMCNGPPHQMPSTSMGWNRPGGSLPNVHQIVQQQMPVDQYNWACWQNQMQPQPSYAPTSRTRSPGAPRYHPYKSNERIPQMDPSYPQNVHLQPPDPSWSNRARSDPTIHMNTVNPNMYYNGQQWMPDFLVNGQSPQVQQTYMPSTMAPNAHLGYASAQQYAQSQPPPVYADQMVKQEIPIGSLPNMPSNHVSMHQNAHQGYMMQQPSTSGMISGPMSAGPYTQQLSTPVDPGNQSVSAPTSPLQSFDAQYPQNWPMTRHFSASPDAIPNIVLTGADGTLDCFQDLNLDSDEMQELLNGTVDPASENQLMN